MLDTPSRGAALANAVLVQHPALSAGTATSVLSLGGWRVLLMVA